jgi:hypothetical protein
LIRSDFREDDRWLIPCFGYGSGEDVHGYVIVAKDAGLRSPICVPPVSGLVVQGA